MQKKLAIKLTILITFLITISSQAQTSVYHSFPESNAIWTGTIQSYCATNCPSPPTPNPVLIDETISYSITGDTIINSITYHKIRKSGYAHRHCSYGSFVDNWWSIDQYAGAFRQDIPSKKVYFVSGTQECLLYDFSLNIGDTLKNGCLNYGGCNVVSSIDSVLIGNTYRKSFLFNSTFTQYSIIEGIGSTSGLLETICPFEIFGTLTCFKDSNQTLYPDTVTACDLITTLTEKPGKQSLIVYPNPVHTTAILETGDEHLNSDLIVYNSLGQIVKRIMILESSVPIDCTDLTNGIYYFQILKESIPVTSGRFAVE